MSDQRERVTRAAKAGPRAGSTAPLIFIVAAALMLPVAWMAWLLVSVALDFPEGGDSQMLFVGLWLVIVVVPLVLLWVAGGHRRRWCAVGAAFSVPFRSRRPTWNRSSPTAWSALGGDGLGAPASTSPQAERRKSRNQSEGRPGWTQSAHAR